MPQEMDVTVWVENPKKHLVSIGNLWPYSCRRLLSYFFDRRAFRAVPHALTWSINVFNACSWYGAGLNFVKFSKSVKGDNVTWARTSATWSSAITRRKCSTERTTPKLTTTGFSELTTFCCHTGWLQLPFFGRIWGNRFNSHLWAFTFVKSVSI
jgi:hypothetical protein